MFKYTSLKLSKKLWDCGCRLDIENKFYYFQNINEDWILTTEDKYKKKVYELYPAYDILWDICIKYRFEFFGNNFDLHEQIRNGVMYYLLSGNNKRAENIIWDNCVFNKEN